MREDSRIDTRALAVLRIGLGVLLVVDILLRARNFWYFYTDRGAVPYEIVADDIYNYPTAAMPIWELSTHPVITAALFTASLLVGVMLITGYKTRLTTVLAFLLVSAIDARNPYVLSYADLLFHFLLLWAMFLPLGERWSIDAQQRIRNPRTSIASFWSALILFQMVLMYLSNAHQKLLPDWSWSGDVLPVLLTLDHITFSHVDYVNGHAFTPALELFSYTWLVLMVSSPILFFLRGHLRAVLAGGIFMAHLSMAATLRIGAFPYASMLGVLLFVQTPTWDAAGKYIHRVNGVTKLSTRLQTTGYRAAMWLEKVEPAPEKQAKARKTTVKLGVVVFLIATASLAGISATNHTGVTDTGHNPVETIDETMHVFGLHQPSWSFYAADPPYTDKYYIAPALTSDGEMIDAYNNQELSYDRPYSDGNLHNHYENTYRERFFMNSMADDERDVSDELREHYAQYLCETWEGENGATLENVQLVQVEEEVTSETRLDRYDRPVQFNELGSFDCT